MSRGSSFLAASSSHITTIPTAFDFSSASKPARLPTHQTDYQSYQSVFIDLSESMPCRLSAAQEQSKQKLHNRIPITEVRDREDAIANTRRRVRSPILLRLRKANDKVAS